MPFTDLEPQAVTSYFVGRQSFIQQFYAHLNAGKRVFLIDTVATYGSGKSTLLAWLYWDVKKQRQWTPIWLPLNEFSLSHTNVGIEDAESLPALIENLFSYRDLLTRLAASLGSKAFAGIEADLQRILREQFSEALRPAVSDVHGGEVRIEASREALLDLTRNQIKAGDVIVNIAVSEALLATTIELAQQSLTQEFLRRFRQQVGRQRFIVFADDFCWIIGSQIGKWFLRGLVRGLENTVVVLLRTDTGDALTAGAADEELVNLPLEPFSFAEVAEYLRKRLGASPLLHDLAEVVYGFSHGHPLMTSMMVDLIRVDRLVDKEDIQRIKALPILSEGDDGTDQLRHKADQLIQSILAEVHRKDPPLEEVFVLCGVMRRFDRDMVAHVLGGLRGLDRPATHVGPLIARLSKYSFVEAQPARDDSGRVEYSFHFFIQERMEDYLRAHDPDLLRRIHTLAAEYYKGLLFDYGGEQTSGADAFVGLYRVEDEFWQDQTTEWLYHLTRLSQLEATGPRLGSRFSRVFLSFTRTFLEAFNWWGWYLKFPFCDQLLYEWGRMHPEQAGGQSRGRALLDILDKFYRAYPEGLFKRGRGDWKQVREAMYSLAYFLEIDGEDPLEELPADDHDARFVRALIEWFLAQAAFLEPHMDTTLAEESYQLASQLFESIGDDWNLAWTYSYLADVHVAAGQFDAAAARVHESLELAQKGKRSSQQDHELISQNYRVLGDAFWAQGDLNQAFREYARAVYHMYLCLAIPEAADLYTLNLYRDTRFHVLGRIQTLARQARRAEALAAATYLREFWNVYWDKIGAATPDLAARLAGDLVDEAVVHLLDADLFPAEPAEDQLGHSSDYTDNVIELASRMARQVKSASPAPILS